MLFHTLKGGTGFELWKKFDKELARELSITVGCPWWWTRSTFSKKFSSSAASGRSKQA